MNYAADQTNDNCAESQPSKVRDSKITRLLGAYAPFWFALVSLLIYYISLPPVGTVKLILTILQLVSGLAVTVVVLLQSGKSAGLSGAIAGGAETFMSKGKAKTWDAKLAKATKWFALAFVLLTLTLNLIK